MIRVRVSRERLASGPLRLDGDEAHYLTRVRRARSGETVELFDGQGRCAEAVVGSIDKEGCELAVGQVRQQLRSGAEVTALVPLLKGERMDVCVEKLVEVGCDRLVLWQAERSVVRLAADKQAARVARIAAQAAAAARQSGQAKVPMVEGLWTLSEAMLRAPAQRCVVLDPRAAPLRPPAPWRDQPSAPEPIASLTLLSGPEGGLSPKELESSVAAGYEPASLTETILRAETAPAIAVALWRWSERLT